ncbi:MAG: hypothetical protein KJ601_06140 [Nanoarchaeota archaeon]|nr:hypothetical protein [Nanoarchaeota archaeon]
MHRSGTSCMAGALRICGLDFGDNLTGASFWNPKGEFEHREINRVDVEILKHLNSSWDDIKPLPDNWHKSENMIDFKARIQQIISTDFKEQDIFAIKEPRISILLPLYLEVFEAIGIDPNFIILERKEIDIINSLKKRYEKNMQNKNPHTFLAIHLSDEKYSILIKKYLDSIDKFTKEKQKVYVAFEDLINRPEQVLRTIDNILKIRLAEYHKVRDDILEFINLKKVW